MNDSRDSYPHRKQPLNSEALRALARAGLDPQALKRDEVFEPIDASEQPLVSDEQRRLNLALTEVD